MNLPHDEMYHRLNDLYDQDYQNNWKRHFAASISFHAPSLPGYEHIKDLELNENIFVYVHKLISKCGQSLQFHF